MKINDVFDSLVAARGDEVVIATMSAGYLWPRHSKSPRDFCFIAPMGAAAPLGLGLAIARPDLRVWVLDGDGSLLMNLGALVTIAQKKPANLVHMVLSNRVYAITGGQPVPGAETPRLAAIAAASGIADTHTIATAGEWDAFLGGGLQRPGPVFADLQVDNGFDRAMGFDYTHGEQALATQGGPGFHALHQLLAQGRA